ncbi:unnamed protein product [Enterobius vermicularis]|uniref:Uncharacterized protein n=1 Tax=Enterobius vermicularis TaxID=51028 RepID=A0A0N4V575_ENTVE|nr:unnamed protein product [Enterobius vermicularis]
MSDYKKEFTGGTLRLKKGGKIFKKKAYLFYVWLILLNSYAPISLQKKENIDLRKIDLTIQREGDSNSAYKTPAEIAFEKRRLQNQHQRLAKEAAVSHREKVERFNAQMSKLTEFNDIPKVSWTK